MSISKTTFEIRIQHCIKITAHHLTEIDDNQFSRSFKMMIYSAVYNGHIQCKNKEELRIPILNEHGIGRKLNYVKFIVIERTTTM